MMKNTIIGIVAALVVLAGGYGAYQLFQKSQKQEYTIESVLSAKPVFYLRVDHLSDRFDRFSRTQLFRGLKSVDYKKASAAAGSAQPSVSRVEQVWDQVFSDENQKLFKTLFGEQLAIAVYANSGKYPENVSIVTRLSPEVAAAESVSRLWGLFSKDLKVESQKYKGKEVTTITGSNGQISIGYTRLGDLLVMGFGVKAAQSAIDVAMEPKTALHSDPQYLKRSKSFFEKSDSVGYLDIKTFYPMLTDELAQLTKTQQDSEIYKAQMKEQLKQIEGIEALVYSSKPGEFLNYKIDVLFDAAALSPEMRILYTCAPQENKSVKFVPNNAIIYQWSTCLDFPVMWSQYKEQVANQGKATGQNIDVDQILGMYEKMIGFSLEKDFLPILGKDFGFYLTDVDLTGFPLPRLVLFIETNGQDKTDAFINKLLALQPTLQVEQEQYKDNLIRFLPIPLGEGFAISYTYVGNTLLLGSGNEIIKTSLDTIDNPSKSILANSDYTSQEGGNVKNSIFFVQFDRLMQKTSQILDWVNETAELNQVQHKAFLSGSKKNLEDLQKRNEELNAQIQGNAADPVALEAAQTELAANEEKIRELNQQIAFYENRAPADTKSNKQVTEDVVKPILEALRNIKYFIISSINGENVLSSTLQMKIE